MENGAAGPRLWTGTGLPAGLIATTPVCRAAADPRQAAAGEEAIVCDDLVSLRRLMAEAGPAKESLPAHPACRAVERTRLGAVERRAMVGGAPFECLTLQGADACVWPLP